MKFTIESVKYGKHRVEIDKADEEKILSMHWCISKKSSGHYVVNRKTGVYLHRFIMKAEKGQTVDHINHNTLDNRKSNLRICSHAENTRNRKGKNKNNTSGLKGVFWIKSAKLWRAQIKVNNVIKYLGYYKNALDAAKEYDKAAKMFHGAFASFSGVELCK
ncbi:MAG TPA: HNH endonuclease [Candidatus Omnitrophota bacterium]|nr:HNH endonuclease [Candidatus Omnitrophota bacterium]